MPYEVSDYDRAAPVGTGQAKTTGNYASNLLPSLIAKKNGFADALYLDPKEHKYIDEFGGATFMALLRMVNSKHQNQTQFYLQSLNVLF